MIPRPKFKEDIRYIYAVGRIKVLEKSLIKKQQLLQLLEEEQEGFIRALSELGFNLDPDVVKLSTSIFDNLLSKSLSDTYRLLDELSHDTWLTDCIKLRYDALNLKACIKKKLYQDGEEPPLVDFGTVSPKRILTSILNDNLSLLPALLKETFIKAMRAFEKKHEPREIDLEVEKEIYKGIMERAENGGNEFFKTYLKLYIDLTNIKNYLRVRSMNEGSSLLTRVLIPKGFIAPSSIIAGYDEPIETIASRYEHMPYAEVLREGINNWIHSGSLATLERLTENLLIQYLRYAKTVSCGVEPVVGFIMAREYELRNLRILIVGKVNQLPNKVISERLRESYV